MLNAQPCFVRRQNRPRQGRGLAKGTQFHIGKLRTHPRGSWPGRGIANLGEFGQDPACCMESPKGRLVVGTRERNG